MKKIAILAVLLLGCSHSRHLAKSSKTVKIDSTATREATVRATIKDSSSSLMAVKSLTASKNRDLSIVETKTESNDPIILTGNFKVDTAAGGGIELSSGGIKLTAKYDPKTGLIKAEVYAKGRGKQTTYTTAINIKDKEDLNVKDSTAKENKGSLKSTDSTGKNKTHLQAKTKEKNKQVESKTKWPLFQVLGIVVAVMVLLFILYKLNKAKKWFKWPFKDT